MSRLYERYLKEKNKNKDILYLFECGKFYIFIDEDAIKINSITTLKLTKLNNYVYKCGFPNNSLDKYLEIFKNLNLDVEVIKDEDKVPDISKVIKNINIDELTFEELKDLLKNVKEYI